MGIVFEEEEFERFPPLVTWAMIGANVAVFALQVALPIGPDRGRDPGVVDDPCGPVHTGVL
ncbi:TPA: hypothetical protein EYP44_03480 [Candidatus Bathyarchaeota archaeon]|nr:hypothetical protein [Candidatus Bathyarchaeota archaeon]